MQQHHVYPQFGSSKPMKRIGRGTGSGHGAFSTRGVKGQKARTGKKIGWWFEGGQTPLHRRMPKLRGFKTKNRYAVQAVNIGDLSVFKSGSAIDKHALLEKGLITSLNRPVKILAQGDAPSKITITVELISASAHKKLEAAGSAFAALAAAQPTPRTTA